MSYLEKGSIFHRCREKVKWAKAGNCRGKPRFQLSWFDPIMSPEADQAGGQDRSLLIHVSKSCQHTSAATSLWLEEVTVKQARENSHESLLKLSEKEERRSRTANRSANPVAWETEAALVQTPAVLWFRLFFLTMLLSWLLPVSGGSPYATKT